MREKSFALLACVFFLLSIVGMAYAQWDDTVIISSTMTFGYPDLAFMYPLECQEYHEHPSLGLQPGEYKAKDVGKFGCKYDDQVPEQDAYKKLIVTLSNAYPGYIVKCKFTIANIGTLAGHINDLTISDASGILTWDEDKGALVDSNGDPIIYVDFIPEPVCSILSTTSPYDKKEFEMTIEIDQNAKECTLYTFEVQIDVEAAP